MPSKYHLDFILNAADSSTNTLQKSLECCADILKITQVVDENKQSGKNFAIQASTKDPTLIFDICSQFGKISSVKVDEEGA